MGGFGVRGVTETWAGAVEGRQFKVWKSKFAQVFRLNFLTNNSCFILGKYFVPLRLSNCSVSVLPVNNFFHSCLLLGLDTFHLSTFLLLPICVSSLEHFLKKKKIFFITPHNLHRRLLHLVHHLVLPLGWNCPRFPPPRHYFLPSLPLLLLLSLLVVVLVLHYSPPLH